LTRKAASLQAQEWRLQFFYSKIEFNFTICSKSVIIIFGMTALEAILTSIIASPVSITI